MKRTQQLVAILALVASAGVVGSDAHAQSFVEDMSVTVIEVPVQVLRDGEPIRGLTRDDFELYDRGVRRQLVAFDVIEASSPREAPTGAGNTRRRAEPPPDSSAGEPAARARPPAVARGRHLLFFFDFQFSADWRLQKSVVAARRLTRSGLGEGDRAAVAMYTGTAGANILVGFTRDPAEVELGLAFIEALIERRPKRIRLARQRLIEYWAGSDTGDGDASASGNWARRRRLMERLGPAAGLALSKASLSGEVMGLAEYDSIAGLDSDDRGAGGSLSERLVGPRLADTRTTSLEPELSQVRKLGIALEELSTLLADVPSPKHLFYFSQGFSTALLTTPETQGRAVSRANRGLRAMQGAGWAIQAVDLDGIPDPLARTGRSAENFGDPQPTQFITGAGRGHLEPPAGRTGFDAEALFYMASETGGQLYENFNNVEEAGRRILRATSVTYLLAFQPEDLVADGALHELEVRLTSKIPGAVVLHRPGYVAPTPTFDASEIELRMREAALLAGDDPVDEIRAATLVAVPRAPAEGPARVPFMVELDGADLVDQLYTGRLEIEFQAYAFGADGSVLDFLTQRLTLDPDKLGERLTRDGLKLSGTLPFPPGRHRLRLLVRELESTRLFARSHPVDVLSAGTALALQPLILESARTGVLIETESERSGWKELGLPPAAMAPTPRVEIEPGDQRPLLLVFYVPSGAEVGLSVRIIDGEGQPATGGSITVRDRLPDAGDGSQRVVGLLDTGGLALGDYRLEMSVSGADGAPLASSSAPFAVVAPPG
ncbi:MAG: VWA domain-containing protein [Thermoanaerobaculia bacterium]